MMRVSRSIKAVIVVLTTFMGGASYSATAQEQLPWGNTAAQSEVITPSTRYDPDEIEPYEDYDTTTGADQDDYLTDSYRQGRVQQRRQPQNIDRYQQNPDYSTYQPAVPGEEWEDEDDGLYDTQPLDRRKAHRRTSPAVPAENHDSSRFNGQYNRF